MPLTPPKYILSISYVYMHRNGTDNYRSRINRNKHTQVLGTMNLLHMQKQINNFGFTCVRTNASQIFYANARGLSICPLTSIFGGGKIFRAEDGRTGISSIPLTTDLCSRTSLFFLSSVLLLCICFPELL